MPLNKSKTETAGKKNAGGKSFRRGQSIIARVERVNPQKDGCIKIKHKSVRTETIP